MDRRAFSVAFLLCAGIIGALPATARAQASISGLVQDSTGAVLPGVTVEASSSALIERVRAVVSDESGRYSIVDLRPGTYSVVFSLPGFNGVRREGIVLEGSVAAQVNTELKVGEVNETITVSGAAPLVDVQSTLQQKALTKEVLAILPGDRSFRGRAALVPGVIVPGYNTGVSAHGSDPGESIKTIDGFRTGNLLSGRGGTGGGGVGGTGFGLGNNEVAYEEMVYDLGAQSAELQVSAPRMNAIPKQGGNRYSGTFLGYGAGSALQADNRTPELMAILPRTNDLTAYTWDLHLALGGPIRRDKLWFFMSATAEDFKFRILDAYLPDGSLAFQGGHVNTTSVARLTYQLNDRNKFSGSFDRARTWNINNTLTPLVSPEAASDNDVPGWLLQLKWNSPISNRLLLEAGVGVHSVDVYYYPHYPAGPLALTYYELSTGRWTGAGISRFWYQSLNAQPGASLTYVTGSHALKLGGNTVRAWQRTGTLNNVDILRLNTLNGNPSSVVVTNQPNISTQELNADLGLYGQDRWTIGRLTVNLGARYDHFNATVPAHSVAAGRFVPAREFAAISNVPNWNDWAVRFGLAYDLFGNGRTALKVSSGRFVAGEAFASTSIFDPLASKTEQRSWRDVDGNRSVLDGNGNVQYAEVGPPLNNNFGLATGILRIDPSLARGINWEHSVLLQHELFRGVSVSGGYYHRRFANLALTDNLLVDPVRDYTPFTFTAPRDPRLPDGGGEVITAYNLNPAKLGLVDAVYKTSSRNFQTYDGLEVTANVSLRNNQFAYATLTSGRTAANLCEVDDPNLFRFCDTASPFRHLVKAGGSFSLPYAISLGVTFQMYDNPTQPTGGGGISAAPYIRSTYNISSAIAGIPITGGGTIPVQLIAPNTLFYSYYKQLDLRIARNFHLGRVRARPLLDLYNLLNASGITRVNENFGALFLRPQAIQPGRYLRLGAQIDF